MSSEHRPAAGTPLSGEPAPEARALPAGPAPEARAFPAGPAIEARALPAGPEPEGRALAHLLLRVGALRRDDAEQQAVYQALLGDVALYDDVRRRLAAVGYELVNDLGHLGVRVAAHTGHAGLPLRSPELHAGHVRLIVYLWVHLVYRQWMNLRRDTVTAAPGQATLFEPEPTDDPTPWISYATVFAEFTQHTSKTYFQGVLKQLVRWRYIRVNEKADRIFADASLYTQIDRLRMEDFVVGLARRMGLEEPAAAVAVIAAGSAPADLGEPTDAGDAS